VPIKDNPTKLTDESSICQLRGIVLDGHKTGRAAWQGGTLLTDLDSALSTSDFDFDKDLFDPFFADTTVKNLRSDEAGG
jgi:hypothetical protein